MSKQQPPLEQIENRMLKSVKLINFILMEIKKENKDLRKFLSTSYAKYFGLGTPYEEAIKTLRQVKSEIDSYLDTIRGELGTKYRRELNQSFPSGKLIGKKHQDQSVPREHS